MTPQGALANDTKSGREAIGRSRGGLTTKSTWLLTCAAAPSPG